MKILLDTHILLWLVAESYKLSEKAKQIILDSANDLFFSVASIWEIVIKSQLGKNDFSIDAQNLRSQLLINGYKEIAIKSEHVIAITLLEPIHKDPFDRLLIAQAQFEQCLLLTADKKIAIYKKNILTC